MEYEQFTRRDFIKVSAASAAAIAGASLENSVGGQGLRAAEPAQALEPHPAPPRACADSGKWWYKGNLHHHTQWSDGHCLPEWAAWWYRSQGYHFVCQSDHDIAKTDDLRFDCFGHGYPQINDQAAFEKAFESENSFWKYLEGERAWGRIIMEDVRQAESVFGEGSVRLKEFEGMVFARLKTFRELAGQFNEPERFLMIPGYEQTGSAYREPYIHMNFINVEGAFPYIKCDTPEETLRANMLRGAEVFEGQDYLFTANHPLWRYYDMQPGDLIKIPEIRFLEITNNGLDQGLTNYVPGAWFPETFWDIVNAYRASHGQGLLWGSGTDDFHEMCEFAVGWNVVRASRLAIPDLLGAMRAGDFYVSNGLDFEDIRFDGKTLAVKALLPEGGKCRMEFIGTRRGYDPEMKVVEPEGVFPRKVECYSPEIGVPLETIEGIEGSYTLKPDDLYVRAKISLVGDDRKDWRTRPAAWTQPYQS